MRVHVLVNEQAGSAADREALVRSILEAFAREGVEAEIRVATRQDLVRAAQELARAPADAVVVAGGDGTVNAAAGALADSGRRMGLLPLGTLNHFARDLGVPLELEEAVRVIARGEARPVDLGDVNGRVFVNNASLGIYPRIVKERKRRRLRPLRWVALAGAALRVFFFRFPLVEVALQTGGAQVRDRTPLLFVGNNEYLTGFFELGARRGIDRGSLGVYLAHCRSRLGLLRLALAALLGRVSRSPSFRAWRTDEAVVETPQATVRVALDGEVVRLAPPLVFRIRPAALRVLLPPAGDAEQPA